MALATIYKAILEETLLLLAEKATTREAWTTLKMLHMGAECVNKAKVQTMNSESKVLCMKEGSRLTTSP